MGGGKTQTSSSTVSIPPEVLARYNSVNATAEQAAATPFQAYSQDPNAFVAPINATQQAGINQVQSNMGTAQPYYDVATGLTMAGAGPANLGQLNTNQYMSPYLQNVVGTTLQAQQMQNAQQASQMMGQQATSGAFGGDRGNIGLSNLAYQQNLANQQALAGQLQSGYTQAQNVAAQQQGADLAAQQANLARLTQAGQSIGGLGTAAQNAAISGGQAALTAGTVPQQTQQAGLTALYNQFLQQQGYPFQTAQFLANIAEGTGALSGSTTTTTGPAPFFSDERVKEGIEPIGETYDGQKIVKFRYKGQHGPKQIGLVAQDVEKHHPEAVGEYHGIKTVDYDKATNEAARRGHYFSGGIVPSSQGGSVGPEHAGLGFAGGGLVDPMDLQQLVAARAQMYAPYASGGLYGQQGGSTPGSKGVVPSRSLPTPKLIHATPVSLPQQSTMSQVQGGVDAAKELGNDYKWLSSVTKPAKNGGAIERNKYPQGGVADDDTPYENTPGSRDIVSQVAAENKQTPQMLRAAQMVNTGQQGTGLGNLLGAASTVKGLYGLGSDIAGGVGSLASGFNAAQNAATLDSVLGSGFTAENIGLGAGGTSAASSGLLGSLGSAIGSVWPFALGAKDGGVIPRQHKADGGKSDNSGQSTDQQDLTPSNAQAHLSYLTSQGADPIVAAGMLGNAGRESHLNATVPGDNGDSFGLYQFNKNGELPAFQKFAKDNNLDTSDPKTQHQFVLNQLNGPYSDVRDAMIKSGDPAQAAKIFMQGYERPSAETAGLGERMSYANLIANGGNPKFGAMKVASNDGSQSQPSGIMGTIGSASDSMGNWYDRNQNWLVPLASGLGAMASSPSRFLGAAILQGIGGAAQASQQQQLQQSQIAKNTLDLVKERFITTPSGVRDKYNPTAAPMTGSQFQDYLAKITSAHNPMAALGPSPTSSAQNNIPDQLKGPVAPSLGGNKQPAQNQVAPQQTAASTQPQPTAQAQDPFKDQQIKSLTGLSADLTQQYLNNTDFSKLPQEQNPDYWQQLSRSNSNLADQYAGWNDTLSATFKDRAKQQAEQAQKLIDSAIQPQLDAAKTATAKNILDSQNAYNHTRDEASLASQMAQQSTQSLDTIIDPKTGNINFPTGPLAPQLHLLAAALQEGGVSKDWIDKNLGSPEAFEELRKNVPNLAMETGRMGLDDKSPLRVTMFNLQKQGVPDGELLPAALKYMVDNGIKPRAKQAMDTWSYLDSNHVDPTTHRADNIIENYRITHPWYHDTQEANNQAPTPPGVKVQNNVVPAPIVALGRPMQYNAQSGLYRDKQSGTIYNANGQVVKGNQ